MHPLYKKAAGLTELVIEKAKVVQRYFGVGALESIYVRCLERELQLAGHKTCREKAVRIKYRDIVFDENLRYDLMVDDCLLIEAKSCEKENMEVWRMQLLTYMKLLDKPLGLVMNFGNESFPRRGVKRVILKGADIVDENVPPDKIFTNNLGDEIESVESLLPPVSFDGMTLTDSDLPSAGIPAGRRQIESVEILRTPKASA